MNRPWPAVLPAPETPGNCQNDLRKVGLTAKLKGVVGKPQRPATKPLSGGQALRRRPLMMLAHEARHRRSAALVLLVILATACEREDITGVGSNASGKPPASRPATSAGEDADARGVPLDKLREQLDKAGWPADAASKVIELNNDWFRRLETGDPAEFNREAKALINLGGVTGIFDVISSHPETALLLAGATEPKLLAASFRNPTLYPTVAGLYLRYAAPSDAAELAAVLNEERHATLICDMIRRGVFGAETAYLQGVVEDAGSREYGRWLDEVLSSALQREDAELCSTWTYVLAQGPAIRRALIDDPGFREEFRTRLWPQFARLLDGDARTFESLMWEPDIWQLLRLEFGDRLIERWGVLPIGMLVGESAYPENTRPKVVQILLDGDNSKVEALYRFKREPLFHDLLRRDGLSSTTLRAVCDKLLAAGSNYPNKLSYLSSLADGAIAEEVGQPVSGPVTWIPLYYTVYEVPKKILQGRDVPAMDWVLAIADPALMLMGPLGPKDIAKAGARPVAERAASREGAALVTKLNGNALTRAVGTTAEKETAKSVTGKFAPWLISEGLLELQQSALTLFKRRATVEITGIARAAFRASHISRESFRRLAGLEARLFMRPDARVFLRLDQAVGPNLLLAGFLTDTAINAGCDISLNSGPGAKAIVATVRTASDAGRAAIAWQKHVSAWWGFNARKQIPLPGDTKH